MDSERLKKIYTKTRGKCHLCHKQLALKNHGQQGAKGAWEIEHSKPKSKGGSDHLNNLYAACIKCNREKSSGTNYSVRSKRGVNNAPLSEKATKKKVARNTLLGLVGGVSVGRFFGPVGAIAGGFLGALFGNSVKTDK